METNASEVFTLLIQSEPGGHKEPIEWPILNSNSRAVRLQTASGPLWVLKEAVRRTIWNSKNLYKLIQALAKTASADQMRMIREELAGAIERSAVKTRAAKKRKKADKKRKHYEKTAAEAKLDRRQLKEIETEETSAIEFCQLHNNLKWPPGRYMSSVLTIQKVVEIARKNPNFKAFFEEKRSKLTAKKRHKNRT